MTRRYVLRCCLRLLKLIALPAMWLLILVAVLVSMTQIVSHGSSHSDQLLLTSSVHSHRVPRDQLSPVDFNQNATTQRQRTLYFSRASNSARVEDLNRSNRAMKDLRRPLQYQDHGILSTNAFGRKVTGANKTILVDLAKVFDKIVDRKLGVPYVMYGGTLLGSFRHHDVIPWDDDIDLLLPLAQRIRVTAALENLYPHYLVFEAGPRLKFYSQFSRKMSTKYPWNWPYVDIHFYQENATHIWDSSREFHHYVYPKSLVFPLHKRLLGGLLLNAPFDSFANLKLTYRSTDCRTLPYSHATERIVDTGGLRTPCEALRQIYPFVHRSPASTGVTETLKIGDTKLYSVIADEPRYAVTQPFVLELLASNKTR